MTDRTETTIANWIDAEERRDPQAFYSAKLVSVRRLQKKGLSDATIEAALGITLKPEHRQPEKDDTHDRRFG
jgi:hypothetical protein